MRYMVFLLLLLLVAIYMPAVAEDAATPAKIDETALLAWASGTASKALTFDFDDYQKVFSKAKGDFTPESWRGLQACLETSGLQENLIKYRQSLYTQQNLTSPPKVESQGDKDGAYDWTIAVPVVETVVAGSKTATRLVTIDMTIERANPMAHRPKLTIVHWEESIPSMPLSQSCGSSKASVEKPAQ